MQLLQGKIKQSILEGPRNTLKRFKYNFTNYLQLYYLCLKQIIHHLRLNSSPNDNVLNCQILKLGKLSGQITLNTHHITTNITNSTSLLLHGFNSTVLQCLLFVQSYQLTIYCGNFVISPFVVFPIIYLKTYYTLFPMFFLIVFLQVHYCKNTYQFTTNHFFYLSFHK